MRTIQNYESQRVSPSVEAIGYLPISQGFTKIPTLFSQTSHSPHERAHTDLIVGLEQ